MKKYLSFALAAALSAAFCATAFAAEDNRQVEVKTHIAPTYNVTIPANTTVISKAENTSFGAITLTDAQLDPRQVRQCDTEVQRHTEKQERHKQNARLYDPQRRKRVYIRQL